MSVTAIMLPAVRLQPLWLHVFGCSALQKVKGVNLQYKNTIKDFTDNFKNTTKLLHNWLNILTR